MLLQSTQWTLFIYTFQSGLNLLSRVTTVWTLLQGGSVGLVRQNIRAIFLSQIMLIHYNKNYLQTRHCHGPHIWEFLVKKICSNSWMIRILNCTDYRVRQSQKLAGLTSQVSLLRLSWKGCLFWALFFPTTNMVAKTLVFFTKKLMVFPRYKEI